MINGLPQSLNSFLKPSASGHRSGEAVKDVATGGVILSQALVHHAEDNIVRNEFPLSIKLFARVPKSVFLLIADLNISPVERCAKECRSARSFA